VGWQGGSTTLWVAGEADDGVVSHSDKDPQAAPRHIFDGLFVGSRAGVPVGGKSEASMLA
jgi:hypothetical protein